VDVLKNGTEAFLLAFWRDSERTIMQHAAAAPVAFDDSVAGGARGGWVHAQHAETAIPGGRTSGWACSFHRPKSTAFASLLLELCQEFLCKKKNGHSDVGTTVKEKKKRTDTSVCPAVSSRRPLPGSPTHRYRSLRRRAAHRRVLPALR
jgi:hypothetical protein